MRSRQDVATVVITLYHLLVMASTTVANHPDHIQLGDHQYSSQFLTYVDQVLLDLGNCILFIKPSVKKLIKHEHSNF